MAFVILGLLSIRQAALLRCSENGFLGGLGFFFPEVGRRNSRPLAAPFSVPSIFFSSFHARWHGYAQSWRGI